MRIIFFDTETTGATPSDHLCQIAVKELGVVEPIIDAMYRPPTAIPPEASMVHHISNKMVADKPLFKESAEYPALKALFEDPNVICVAHNAQFDARILLNDDITVTSLLCTFKVIRNLDTDSKFLMHKLQYLRYALDIELDVASHEAFADVLVLEKLFEYELAEAMKVWSTDREATLRQMMALTSEPLAIKGFDFGKYKGKTIAEVATIDPGYLSWMLEQKRASDKDETDWIYTLEKFTKK